MALKEGTRFSEGPAASLVITWGHQGQHKKAFSRSLHGSLTTIKSSNGDLLFGCCRTGLQN